MTMDKIQETAAFLKKETGFAAEVGIILGTGLGELVEHVEIQTSIDYENIPNFPLSTVETHKGKLIFGTLKKRKVVVMQGRFHYYEGYSMKQITFPVRVMKLLGIERLYISNVSGGLNPDFETGDIMIINDHINLLPENPLTGKNENSWGPRFPDMLETYNPDLINAAFLIGKSKGFRIHKGVYVSVPGPNLETPAEYRYLRIIGADAVGMSTIPEVIAARHANLEVFGISIITDICVPGRIKPVNIEEILSVANETQPKLTAIIQELVGVN